jgi:hypothetical protein
MVGYRMAHENIHSDSKVYNTGIELLVIEKTTKHVIAHCKTSTCKLKKIGNYPCHWYL